jgi:hypothetical protein
MIQTKPCTHIRPWLSPLLDSKLGGLLGAYVHWHVERCPKCKAALENLKEIVVRLSGHGAPGEPTALPDDRRAKLEAAWDTIERRRQPAP